MQNCALADLHALTSESQERLIGLLNINSEVNCLKGIRAASKKMSQKYIKVCSYMIIKIL